MSVNKVILVGNLGKDPELTYTPSGAAVCKFSVATTEKFKNKTGDKQETTEWHNVVVWRELAEVCEKYLTKGKQVYLEGKIKTQSYDDRDGNKKYFTEVVCHVMQMLGAKGEPQGNNQQQSGDNINQQFNQAQDKSLNNLRQDMQHDDGIPY